MPKAELSTFASCNQGDCVQQSGTYLELQHNRENVSRIGRFFSLLITTTTWKDWFMFREFFAESKRVGTSATGQSKVGHIKNPFHNVNKLLPFRLPCRALCVGSVQVCRLKAPTWMLLGNSYGGRGLVDQSIIDKVKVLTCSMEGQPMIC